MIADVHQQARQEEQEGAPGWELPPLSAGLLSLRQTREVVCGDRRWLRQVVFLILHLIMEIRLFYMTEKEQRIHGTQQMFYPG